MNENSTKKGYLGAELAQADTVTTKLARVGTTVLAIMLGLLLAACPSNSSSGGNGGGSGNGNGGTAVPTRIAIWSLGNLAGDFGFAACQTRLAAGATASGGTIERRLYADGYRNAYFFGSTPANPATGPTPAGTGYDFTALATGDPEGDGLNLAASQAARTGAPALGVAAYDGTAPTVTTTFGTPAAEQTVGELIGGVSTTGTGTSAILSLSTAGRAIMAVANSASISSLFWSFTTSSGVYDSTNNCGGAASTSGSGILGNTTRVGGGSAAAGPCFPQSPVICVAK